MSATGSGYRGSPHRRRVRVTSNRRLVGRGFWVVIAAGAALIITSGFAVAAFTIGTFSSNPLQSAATGTPNAPPGVTYPLAEAQLVNATTVPAAGACTTSNLGHLATPTALVSAVNTAICLNTPAAGFATSDYMYIFEISWSSTSAISTIFEVQIGVDVVPVTNDFVATSYVETSATISTTEEATYALDLTAASDTSVVQFNVLVTQL